MGLCQHKHQYEAFNTALQNLYHDDILQLAGKGEPFQFNEDVFNAVASLIYQDGGFDISQIEEPAARELINETFRVLNTAIDSGLPHEVPETVRYALENNAFVFSGFKTFHTMREIGLSMVTDKGHIKPFNDFLSDVKKIHQLYDHNYLYAEYNHAVGTSLMAAKWNEFEQDGDKYDLQYRTANDGRVREEHRLLHGTTLPLPIRSGTSISHLMGGTAVVPPYRCARANIPCQTRRWPCSVATTAQMGSSRRCSATIRARQWNCSPQSTHIGRRLRRLNLLSKKSQQKK